MLTFIGRSIMPDKTGKLNEGDGAIIRKWMEAQDMACPVCRKKNFNVFENLVAIPPIQNGKLQTTGEAITVLPLLLVTCTQCGFVSNLSALAVGIL